MPNTCVMPNATSVSTSTSPTVRERGPGRECARRRRPPGRPPRTRQPRRKSPPAAGRSAGHSRTRATGTAASRSRSSLRRADRPDAGTGSPAPPPPAAPCQRDRAAVDGDTADPAVGRDVHRVDPVPPVGVQARAPPASLSEPAILYSLRPWPWRYATGRTNEPEALISALGVVRIQAIAQRRARPVQHPLIDRRQLQQLADLFVGVSAHVAQRDDAALAFGQPEQSSAERPPGLGVS